MYKHHYSRFLAVDPQRLHFAAHSHHLWPDATRDAQQQYWDDTAELVDTKWGRILDELVPSVRAGIASRLGLARPHDICLAPNTHELVSRLLSCFDLTRPLRILTTDGEFHSFARQSRRYEELPQVQIHRVPVSPFATFEQRFAAAARTGDFEFVYFSHVFFASGFAVRDLSPLVSAVSCDETIIAVDGYHAFCALPTDLAAVESRIFYLAGGYKYAQAGEGACFMSQPQDCQLRPLNTGWYASFASLADPHATGPVHFAEDGYRFWGATFDPSGLYRLNAVFGWMDEHGLTIPVIHEYVAGLQSYFLDQMSQSSAGRRLAERLLLDSPDHHGHFFTFELPEARAIHDQLTEQNVVVDVRGDCLRFGFGLYQTREDIDRLLERLEKAL